jgi:isopenicillin-N N-acyltransferase like protein
MCRLWQNRLGLLCASLLAVATVQASQPRSFREGRSGEGELRYINDVPVLIVAGTPEEIGRQKSALTREEAKTLAEYPKQFVERAGSRQRWTKLLTMAWDLVPQFPPDHLAEIRAFREHSGVDRDLGVIGNTLPDIYRGGFGCSSLIVASQRSATNGPLFGRNLDFFTLGMLDKYNLVTVYRPKGKHAFASIGFPGLFGCLSGMNDAGLALAVHEVFLARDHAPLFNPKGVPYTLAFRRILEECTNIAEAERLLRSMERTTLLNLAVCDREKSVVFELTPNSVVARSGRDGLCLCTNHFRSPELAVDFLTSCRRYRILSQAWSMEKLDVADVAEKLNQVNLGVMTVQSMIFEPAALKLHLAIGGRPASSQPMRLLELVPLFQPPGRP